MRYLFVVLVAMMLMVSAPVTLFAQQPNSAGLVQSGLESAGRAGQVGDFCQGADPKGCVSLLFGNVLNVLFSLAGFVLLGYLLYAGFLWMTSGGETDKATEAMQTIRNAIIGLVILATSFAIANFILTSLRTGVTGETSSEATASPAPAPVPTS